MPGPVDGPAPDPDTIARPWIDAYPPGVPPTYRYPAVLLTRFLDDASRDFPATTAIESTEAHLAYPAVVDIVDRLAGALEGLGIDHGRPLGLLLSPGPAALVACFAAWRLGAVVVPVDPARDEADVIRRLKGARCEVLLTSDRERPRLRAIQRGTSTLRRAVVTGDADWQTGLRRTVSRIASRRRRGRQRAIRDDVVAFGDLIDASPPRAAQHHAELDDTAVVLFDEDGTPLAFSHRHLVAAAFQSRLWVPDVQAGRERIAVAAPLDDPVGLVAGLLDPVLSAGTIITVRDRTPKSFAALIEETAPTLVRAPAAAYEHLVETSHDLSSLRAGLAVGAPLDADLVAAFLEVSRGARLRRSYGPVAACGLTHANPVYGRAVPHALGLPVTDTVACVVDPDDATRVLGPGETGRLLVQGPQVTTRRWQPSEDAAPPAGPWLDTGDLAAVGDGGVFVSVTAIAAEARTDGPVASPAGTLNPPAATDEPSGGGSP